MKQNNPGKNRPTQTASFTITRDRNGIFYRHVKTDAHIDLKEVKDCEDICLSMNGGKKILTIIDARNFHTLTPEATRYLKDTQNKSRIATAVISTELSQKITAGFIKNKVPVKIFSTENEAVKWLMEFRKKP